MTCCSATASSFSRRQRGRASQRRAGRLGCTAPPTTTGSAKSTGTASRCSGPVSARATARARAWRAGAAPGRVVLDFDATPISIHCEKELAAGRYKGGFAFNPLLASCGRKLLAGVLRPGHAGANNADDHLRVLELALEQLSESALDGDILARSDSAGASHDFANELPHSRVSARDLTSQSSPAPCRSPASCS